MRFVQQTTRAPLGELASARWIVGRRFDLLWFVGGALTGWPSSSIRPSPLSRAEPSFGRVGVYRYSIRRRIAHRPAFHEREEGSTRVGAEAFLGDHR